MSRCYADLARAAGLLVQQAAIWAGQPLAPLQPELSCLAAPSVELASAPLSDAGRSCRAGPALQHLHSPPSLDLNSQDSQAHLSRPFLEKDKAVAHLSSKYSGTSQSDQNNLHEPSERGRLYQPGSLVSS